MPFSLLEMEFDSAEAFVPYVVCDMIIMIDLLAIFTLRQPFVLLCSAWYSIIEFYLKLM